MSEAPAPATAPHSSSLVRDNPDRIGLHAEYAREEIANLVVKRHGSKHYVVMTPDGHELLGCKGKHFSTTDSKVFSTPKGETLFTLKQVPLTPYNERRFYIEDTHGEHRVEMVSAMVGYQTQFDVTLKNTAGGNEDILLKVRGDIDGRDLFLTFKNQPLARLKAKDGRLFGALKTNEHHLIVSAGVDWSLIAAIVVALDANQDEREFSYVYALTAANGL